MKELRTITVIHLIWIPYGVSLFKRFIDSYLGCSAGNEHVLLLVFNGVNNPSDTMEYHEYMKAFNISYTSVEFREGQDLECYFKASERSPSSYIILLNSFSVILGRDWLRKFIDQFSDPAIGVVGATASYQSYYSSVYQKHPTNWEGARGFLYNFRKYKLFIKAFFYWRILFKPFPNPHLRTNAFMVRRESFLEMKKRPVNTKFKAYQFENGRNSLTNFYLAKGLKVLVVDKYGKTFEPTEWKSSKTFWTDNQENLLVSDNQTTLYADASATEKKEMTRLAWGTI
ncbi:MAG: hypothetical protein ABI813_07250 [Bacteroidota bacterium]